MCGRQHLAGHYVKGTYLDAQGNTQPLYAKHCLLKRTDHNIQQTWDRNYRQKPVAELKEQLLRNNIKNINDCLDAAVDAGLPIAHNYRQWSKFGLMIVFNVS